MVGGGIGFTQVGGGEGSDPSTPETLTNKTITSLSNNVHSDLLHYPVKHTSGGTLPKGTPLRFVAWDNDVLKVAQATTKYTCIGVAGIDLLNGEVGCMVVIGALENVNTSTFLIGGATFVDANGLTSTKGGQQVGVCLKVSADDGVILINTWSQSYLATGMTGYDRENLSTLPILEFCVSASSGVYRRIMQDDTHTEHTGQTTFGDGVTALGDRTWCVRPESTVEGFSFSLKNEQVHIYNSHTYQAGTTEGIHILSFNADGLNAPLNVHQALVEEVITSIVYCDGQGGYELFADERHGREMDAIDHERIHMTTGCVYQDGLIMTGLASASEVYSTTTSGVLWDEDKKITLELQAEHPFIYRAGVDGHWLWTSVDNRVALSTSRDNTTASQWNKWTGTEWILTNATASLGYVIMHFLATNNSRNPIVKVVGQSAYATVKLARNAIEKEVLDIDDGNLPSPELKFLYSIIVNMATQLEELTDGSLLVDFRKTIGSGNGAVGSSGVSAHSELTGLDVHPTHPIESLSGVDSVKVGVDVTEITIGYASVVLTTLYGSLSIGTGHSIFGLNSIVIGSTNTVGADLVADTDFNVCIGENCTATGKYCIALGDQSEATGLRSLARGYRAYAYDYLSTSIGRYSISDGRCSFASGEYVNTNNIDYGVVFGSWNIQKTDLILCIGNGNGIPADPNEYSNRLEQFINGDLRLPTLQLVDIVNEKSVTTVEYVHTPTVVTETGMATYTPDFSRTVLHEYIITQATTVTNPINALKGKTGTMLIAQGATAYAITLGTIYQLVGTLTEVANETTMLRYTVVSETKTTLEVVTTY